MAKKINTKRKISFFGKLFHKPLLLIFILGLLPFILWGSQQTQLLVSMGKNNRELKINLQPQQQSSCPTTSSQTYSSRRQNRNNPNILSFDPSKNPETNIVLRGWYEVNEGKNLISRNGNNYGLDPNMPPQISTLFTSHYPKIIKTYRVNDWDYQNNHNIPGQSATPAYAVHVLGLEAIPGEPLVGLKPGPFLVRYATPNYILMTYGDEDLWDSDDDGGYPFYYLDICVDPNLLAAYESANAGGRNELPMVATGQVFGYAMTSEVKFVIRDTFSFMDARYKEDWWEYGGFKPSFSAPPPTNNNQPTQIPTALPTSPPVVFPTNQPPPTHTPIPNKPAPTKPASIQPTTYNPLPTTFIQQPTTYYPLPTKTITLTPTPKPFIDVKKTVENAKSVWTRIFVSFVQFTKVILP